MALSRTPASQAGDDFAIYNLQSTSIFPTVIFPNGANINNIVPSDLISPQSPGFTDYSGDTIKSIEVDNASSLLLIFPLWGISIQPFTTGYAYPVFPEQSTLWVQAILPRNIANTSFETVSIRVYSFQTQSKSPGAGNSGITDAVVADNQGFFILSVYGSSSGQANAQPNGLYVANGYDAINPDGATTGYTPARTPNVYAEVDITAGANTSDVTIYTAPANTYWRLMKLRCQANKGLGGTFFIQLGDNVAGATGKLGAYSFPPSTPNPTTNSMYFEASFVGNGYKSAATGSFLNIHLFTDVLNVTCRIAVELYVGP